MRCWNKCKHVGYSVTISLRDTPNVQTVLAATHSSESFATLSSVCKQKIKIERNNLTRCFHYDISSLTLKERVVFGLSSYELLYCTIFLENFASVFPFPRCNPQILRIWMCFRSWRHGEYPELRKRKWQENRETYIMRNCVIFFSPNIIVVEWKRTRWAGRVVRIWWIRNNLQNLSRKL
jgi:hypothetical protein